MGSKSTMARGLNFFRLLEVFTFYKPCFTSVESFEVITFFLYKNDYRGFYLDIWTPFNGQPELEVFTFTSAFSKFHLNLMSNSRYSSLFSLLLTFYDNFVPYEN